MEITKELILRINEEEYNTLMNFLGKFTEERYLALGTTPDEGHILSRMYITLREKG